MGEKAGEEEGGGAGDREGEVGKKGCRAGSRSMTRLRTPQSLPARDLPLPSPRPRTRWPGARQVLPQRRTGEMEMSWWDVSSNFLMKQCSKPTGGVAPCWNPGLPEPGTWPP